MTFSIGEFVISKAGHDKNAFYVIIKEENEYVYLSDGKYKPLNNLKRKNKKHVQIIHDIDSSIKAKLENSEALNDVDIANAIKQAAKKYKK